MAILVFSEQNMYTYLNHLYETNVRSISYTNVHAQHWKKSLKIPKGQSEYVYRRKTDNTMAKRKSTKGQTTINKTYT